MADQETLRPLTKPNMTHAFNAPSFAMTAFEKEVHSGLKSSLKDGLVESGQLGQYAPGVLQFIALAYVDYTAQKAAGQAVSSVDAFQAAMSNTAQRYHDGLDDENAAIMATHVMNENLKDTGSVWWHLIGQIFDLQKDERAQISQSLKIG